MAHNRVFFPQSALDAWLAEGKVDLRGDELALLGEGRRYRIVEAVRTVKELTGAPDVNLVVGRVKTRAYLVELGADLVESSMVLGDAAYEVVPGFLGTPIGAAPEPTAVAPPSAPGGPRSEAPSSGPSGLELADDVAPLAPLLAPPPPIGLAHAAPRSVTPPGLRTISAAVPSLELAPRAVSAPPAARSVPPPAGSVPPADRVVAPSAPPATAEARTTPPPDPAAAALALELGPPPATATEPPPAAAASSDEELLARFLLKRL